MHIIICTQLYLTKISYIKFIKLINSCIKFIQIKHVIISIIRININYQFLSLYIGLSYSSVTAYT